MNAARTKGKTKEQYWTVIEPMPLIENDFTSEAEILQKCLYHGSITRYNSAVWR